MSIEKNMNTRIQHKHDSEANWNKAVNFIPIQGEIIVYDIDEIYNYERVKIGDGIRKVNDLPFVDVQPDWNQNDETTLDYVKNRPFYDSSIVLLDWDGDISKIEDIVYMDAGGQQLPFLYRIGDSIPYTAAEISALNETSEPQIEAVGTYTTESFDIYSESGLDMYVFTGNNNGNRNSIAFYNITTDGFVVEALGNLVIPKSGLWALGVDNSSEYNVLRCAFEKLKTLDEKFIPDTIARVSDVEAVQNLVGESSVSEQIATAIENSGAVLYTEQSLTDEQKSQARINIGFTEENALIVATETGLIDPVTDETGAIYIDENNAIYTL